MKKASLGSDDKLMILRKADPYREWKSLDDRRTCVLCDRTITGRQIDITVNGRGRPRLNCPTEGCNASPHEWVYPGNPLTSEKAWRDWSRMFDDEPKGRPRAVAAHPLLFHTARA